MTTLRDQVVEFHHAFGQPVVEVPSVPPEARVQLRLRLITEEFCELLEACGAQSSDVAHYLGVDIGCLPIDRVDIVAVADALADLDYVIEGTRIEFGINGEPIADEVHRSNMAKVGATIRPDGKVIKPVGWTPPDIAGCLGAQGWDGK